MKKFIPSVISILAAILLIVIGYKLDHWISALARIYRQDANGPFDWMAWAYLANVLMVSLSLAWLWFTHRSVQRNRVVALIYVVLGAGLLIYPIVASSIRFDSPSFILYFYIAPNSSAAFASAFMIVFGLQRLIFGQSAL
jgi:hypothetical protein